MATLLSSLETQARRHLIETTASFWSSAELIDLANKGIRDLWGAIIDLHAEHYLTVDISNVSLIANATQLTGVPANTFRVHIIEPRDTTDTASTGNVVFQPRDYNSQEFISARSLSAQDPTSATVIYYAITGAGSPVTAPVVLIAPKISSSLALRFVYIPTILDVVAAEYNPIAGESDNALIAWTVAYARAKEREDRSPDPNWLAIYATEKQQILQRMSHRQEQEPDFAHALFEELWG